MPIDTRFLQSAKDKVQAARRAGTQFIRENRRLSMGSAAAMLLAPAIFKNDNRGYVQTAAVTTPLISSATYAVPSVVGSFRSQFSPHATPAARRVAEAWQAAQERKGVRFEDIRQATQDYSSQSVPLNVYQDTMRRHYAGRLGKRAAEDLTPERNALTSHLNRVLMREQGAVTAGEIQYLSNAIHAEKLRTLSAADLLTYRKFLDERVPDSLGRFPSRIRTSPIAPMLTKDEILATVNGQLNNSSFIRGMNSRVQRMNGLIFLDKKVGASDVLLSRYSSSKWGASELMTKRLAAEHPEVFKSIQGLLKTPGFDANDLSILSLEEEGQTLAALRYKGIDGITIPLVQNNGSVLLGQSFRRVGISRKVYTSDRLMGADVYALEALKRGQSLADISTELQRINIVGQVNASEDFSSLTLPEGAEYVNSNGGFALRSRQAVPSELYGFTRVDPKTGDSEVVGFSALNAESKEAAILQSVEKHGFTKVGSESGVSKGTFELKETEQLAALGLANREKQNPAWRSYTKPIQLTKTPQFPPSSTTKTRDSLRPFFETDYMTKIAPNVDKREIGIRVAGITGGEKTLFGDLPETVGGLEAYGNTAVNIIAKERGVSTNEARKAWMEFSSWLSKPQNLKAMRRLGTLGEGGFLMRHNLYGMGVERTVRYDMHELHVKDWQSMIGQPIEDALGLKKDQKAVLGYFNGNPVVAGGKKNFIENVHELGDGILGVDVREVVPFGTGTKVDAGIKGLVSAVGKTEMKRVREGLNRFYKAVGTGGYIADEVEAIQVLHYGQNKEEALEAVLNATGDTFRRLEESGETEAVAPYMTSLADQGLVYRDGTLTFETAALKTEKSEAIRTKVLNTIEQMFADVSSRLEKGQLQGDEFMRRFATSNEDSYLQWIHRYADPRSMRAWNTTQWNVPQETKVTYDMLQQLSMKGYHGALGDILDRVKYDGDPMMTGQLKDYLAGSREAITEKYTLAQALNNAPMGAMSTPDGRAGTFFDPGSQEGAKNYIMSLPDGSEVPVLGHEAYGGKVNRYGAAQFSASEHEKSLMGLMRAYEGKTPDTKKAQQLRQAYLDSLKQFVHGKNSYLRADATDTLALGQFFQTRASTLRYEDGSVNPFEMGIGRDMVEKIRDKDLRKALYSGDDVFAALARHPVSDMPFMRVVIDDRLTGTNVIGVDEGMRGLSMADDDGDMAWAFLMKGGSKGHQEAADAVAGIDPRQKASLAFQQKLEGVGDDPRAFFRPGARSDLTELGLKDVMKEARKAAPSLDAALRARSTSGSIGAFSNTLTQMLIGLEHNTNVTDLGTKRDLSRFFFTSVRQGPISAAKLKSGQDMDLSRALGINAKLQRNIGPGGSFDQFYSALGELADAADGSKGSAFRDYLSTNRSVLESYHAGFDHEAVAQATRVLTTPAGRAANAKTLGMSPDLMSYIQAASTSAESSQVNRGATLSAETLGLWNRAQTAGRKTQAALRESKVGLILGAGVAIAAAAGIVSGMNTRPQAVFGRESGNRYRPEEKAGVSNAAPGAASEGTRAARPRRTMVPAPAQTRTTVVAPIHDSTDLDVQVRAKDRSRAHETAKLLRRVVTSGDSNVTINYRDPKRTSLRSRERMRDTLEE